MGVSLLPQHRDSLASIFDSSVAAGVSVFRVTEAVLCVIFCRLAVVIKSLYCFAHKCCVFSSQFSGFSSAINFQAKVAVTCVDNIGI